MTSNTATTAFKTWFFDFETFYSKEYSLRKMTPVEYVLDPRFEAIGCAVKEGVEAPAYWVDGPDLPKYFKDIDPEVTIGVSHNWLFDGCVLAWRYNFIPKLAVCTMSVARATLGHMLRSVSLDSVSQHIGLPPKGNTVHKVEGMTREAIIAAGIYDEYSSYSKRDCENCAGIYDRLVRSGTFPQSELIVMDTVLRCAIQPRFRLDPMLLAEHLADVRAKKEHLLAQAMLTNDVTGKSDFMSNERFADLLRERGVDPPMKLSRTTGKAAYAFARTDVAMIELEEHPDPAVQILVAARLGHKSTLEETRTERLIKISQVQWPEAVTHPGNEACNEQIPLMPVPLRFSGAHTHRLSGDWKLNLQNLPTRKGNTIRRALIAPPGHKVVVPDASQIEARIVAWVCGQLDLVEQFRNKEDVYSSFASLIFDFPVNKKDHPGERFVGKTGILGLGYQTGWMKLQHTIKVQSKEQLGTPIELSDAEALKVVSTYRSKYPRIPAAWKALQGSIPVLAAGGSFEFGPCLFEKGSVLLPSGLRLHYHDLSQQQSERGSQWQFTYAGKPKKLYGGALLENIVQALARIHTMDAAVRIRRRVEKHKIWLNLQAHDELAYVVPDEAVTVMKGLVTEEMARPPVWAPDLPLASEVGVGQSYGEAK